LVDRSDLQVSEPWARFVGVVEGGRLKPFDGPRLKLTMNSLEGRRVEMAIRTEDPGRNLPQNAYLHVLARLIAAESGETLERIKRLAVLHALGVEAGTSSEVILGAQVVIVKRTSDLKKDEASKVLEWLLEKCSFLNIRPPNREEVEVMP
jgi:hypothetical protein